MTQKKASPSNLAALTAAINQFRDERNWTQFHTPKDLALSIVLEATELLEHFQWKRDDEVAAYVAAHRDEIADEVADVLNYLLQFAHDVGIDVLAASEAKLAKNAAKYPVKTVKALADRGQYRKYNRLSDHA